MAVSRVHLGFTSFLLGVILLVNGGSSSKFSLESTACNLLSSKFVASNPLTVYPIVFEPNVKGRLTVWTGISTLPTSEFKCYGSQNATNKFVMNFANFANKFEWTFYDLNKGVTHNGVTVNHCGDRKYELTIGDKQKDSFMDCNTIVKIEQLNDMNSKEPILQTACQDCSHSLIALIDSLIKELIKSRFEEQIMDNLYWHVTQLLSSQHFTGPFSLNDNFN